MNMELSHDRSIMICQRLYPLRLLGIGVCLLLVLETINLWTHSRSPDIVNRTFSPPVPGPPNRVNPRKAPTTQNQKLATTVKAQEPVLNLLSPEQILRNMNSSIVEYQVQSPKTTRHVFVVSYFRSGSTFTADLLQQNWKTFYTYEPLHYMSSGQRINDTQLVEAFHLLKDLTCCNFSSSWLVKYLERIASRKRYYLVRYNKFLYLTCSISDRNTELCFRPDFLQYLCNRSPWQVMKLNRLSMEQVGRFVRDNPELDIRVLHLVRDPRGIFSSRKDRPWCNKTACGDFKVLCEEMDQDYKAFQGLKELYPQSFFQIRYEDLSSRPKEVSKQVFAALDLPYTEKTTEFLNRNTRNETTSVEHGRSYSTRRNSYKTAFKWREKLTLEEVIKVQTECANVLTNYDYLLVNSSQQLVGSPQKVYSSQKSWLTR